MGLTRPRAHQIFDIDYKQAVRVITTSNITLSGGAPTVVDGVTLALNDRVLVAGQNTASQNGLYYVTTLGTGSNGTWQRSIDGNETGEIQAGMVVMVTEGTSYADSQWKLITNDPITVGISALTFEQSSAYAFGTISANSTSIVADTVGDTVTFTPGNNFIITGNAATDTITFSVTQSPSFSGTLSATGNANVGNLGTAGLITATGNIAGGNLLTSGLILATSNITGGNINTIGLITATGNVTGANFLTGGLISATGNILTGTNIFVAGYANVTNTVTAGNINTGGTVSATGNITGGNLTTSAQVIATGNITGGNLNTGAQVVATGNITGGNLTTSAQVIATGNITGGNLNTGAQVVATGNITGGNLITAGKVYGLELTSTQSSGDEGGQINLGLAATNTSLSGSVVIDIYQNKLRFYEGGGTARGAFLDISGCGAGVSTNLLSGGGGGSPGGANTYVQFNDSSTFGGNSQFTYDKVTNIVTAGTFAGTLNGTGQNFKVGDDAWIGDINQADTIGLKGQQNAANCYIVFGNSDSTGKLGRAGTGPLTYAGAFSATGNISGGNANIAGQILVGSGNAAAPGIAFSSDISQDTGFYWISDGNIGVTTNGTLRVTFNNAGGISATGAITGASLSVSTGNITGGNIVNGGSNGVGNIGSATTYFNTVFAKATSSQYADVAERYEADADYPVGTVLIIGGKKEVTQSTAEAQTSIAGTVSENPGVLMNRGMEREFVSNVALIGRVPCRVIGDISKGDLLMSSIQPGVATKLRNYQPGCVIGKALESYNSENEGIIEILIGRL